MTQNRQPRGIPAGGEFAANRHDEAGADLEAAPELAVSAREQLEAANRVRRSAAFGAKREVASAIARDFRFSHPEVYGVQFELGYSDQGAAVATIDEVAIDDSGEDPIRPGDRRWNPDWKRTFDRSGELMGKLMGEIGITEFNGDYLAISDAAEDEVAGGGLDRWMEACKLTADADLRCFSEDFTSEYPDVAAIRVSTEQEGGEWYARLKSATLADGTEVDLDSELGLALAGEVLERGDQLGRAVSVWYPGTEEEIAFGSRETTISSVGIPVPACNRAS